METKYDYELITSIDVGDKNGSYITHIKYDSENGIDNALKTLSFEIYRPVVAENGEQMCAIDSVHHNSKEYQPIKNTVDALVKADMGEGSLMLNGVIVPMGKNGFPIKREI